VSSNPGKTATINFYDIDKTLYFVDLPGYGFAKVSKSEKEKWSNMIEEYLNSREQLVQVILLVDFRHKPTSDDIMMFNWIVQSGYDPFVVATKLDKVKSSQRENSLKLIMETLNTANVIPVSSENGDGIDLVWLKLKELIGVDDNDCESSERDKRCHSSGSL
ncbi:MAG: ribosome biogenesis GTP-binding protein YsxC, partial [Clostridia bacterium]|nr:ribosome biogenesis GTP-binding protein YsxC [Clostridia bacterium]